MSDEPSYAYVSVPVSDLTLGTLAGMVNWLAAHGLDGSTRLRIDEQDVFGRATLIVNELPPLPVLEGEIVGS